MQNYQNLIDRIENRYNPDRLNEVSLRTFSTISDFTGDVAKYVRLAMMQVDDSYTRKTLDAGSAVQDHLKKYLSIPVEFKYQGSVMTQTHIRGVSDIDLLTIIDKFNGTDLFKVWNIINTNDPNYSYSDKQKLRTWHNNFNRYEGNSCSDLSSLRRDCEIILQRIYSECNVSKPKSIRIRNSHYNREVDVVVSNWYDSVDYIRDMGSEYRGIQIYDKHLNQRLDPDYPFLSIKRINDRSTSTSGRLKRMIRFLKNVRTDSDQEIKLTSFDINAICYDIPTIDYASCSYLDLVPVVYGKLLSLCAASSQRDSLKSVVGDEYIFKDSPDKVAALKLLKAEVLSIITKLQNTYI